MVESPEIYTRRKETAAMLEVCVWGGGGVIIKFSQIVVHFRMYVTVCMHGSSQRCVIFLAPCISPLATLQC